MIGLGLGLTLSAARAQIFDLASLFAGGEQGARFDPSDLETMFQDTAGTTPVTAPAQTVGLVLDKSQGLALGPELVTNGDFSNGTTGWTANSATLSDNAGRLQVVTTYSSQGASQSFATVSGRRYQISVTVVSATTNYTIGYGNAFAQGQVYDSGALSGARTFTASFVGNGTSTVFWLFAFGAGTFIFDNISVRELPGNHATQPTAANRPTYGVVPSRGRVNLLLNTDTLANQNVTVTAAQHTLSFTGTGTVTLSGASTAGPLVGTGANNRVSLTFTPTAGTLTLTVSGSVTLGQLQLGATFDAYQRVVSQFDVTDPAGFPSYPLHYLYFGGDLDPRWLQTSTITPNADKVQVFAGVRKLSDAAAGAVVEFSASATANLGSAGIFAPFATSGVEAQRITFASRGSTGVTSASPIDPIAAPVTAVVSGLGDISGDTSTLRVNGTQVAQNTADQGTGNYLAYPLFIGRRAGTSIALNGQLYGLIVRFSTANLDASVISQTERWMAYKTGVTL